MPYNEALAARVRANLKKRRSAVEKALMGSLAFMVDGSMACAVGPNGLLVRILPEARDDLLTEPHVTPMQMAGRTMQGFVRVALAGLRGDAALAKWVERGVAAGASSRASRTSRTSSTKKKAASSISSTKKKAASSTKKKLASSTKKKVASSTKKKVASSTKKKLASSTKKKLAKAARHPR